MTMKKKEIIKFFSWFSIIVGIFHFILETWFHFRFEQSIIQLFCDYIGISLLIFAGIIVLKNINGKGLLCGAWGYSFCLNYRAFAWRMDEFIAKTSSNSTDNTLIILSFTLFFSFIAFIYSLIICYPNEKKQKNTI